MKVSKEWLWRAIVSSFLCPVYFYNFHWKDYAGVGEAALLDMVKVVTFALSQGKVSCL